MSPTPLAKIPQWLRFQRLQAKAARHFWLALNTHKGELATNNDVEHHLYGIHFELRSAKSRPCWRLIIHSEEITLVKL